MTTDIHTPRFGSSPHTRGAPIFYIRQGLRSRIIPAYAGSTKDSMGKYELNKDHPRIRGEHDASRPPTGSVGWIIPAYAGSTSTSSAGSPASPDHPRIRGEHAAGGRHERYDGGSSPHTRGARGCAHDCRGRAGIIPAYAGSTRPGIWSGRASPDHPRIRGEHFRRSLLWRASPGSSPHTRGARERGHRG